MPISSATSSPMVKVPNQPDGSMKFIGTLEVHVGDACRRGSIDVRRNRARPLHAGEARHVACRCRVRRFSIEPPLILALTFVVRNMTAPARCLVLFPAGEPRLVLGCQIGLE